MGLMSQDDLFGAYLLWLGSLWILIRLTLVLGLVALGMLLWKRRIGKFLSYSLVISCSSMVSAFVFLGTGICINRCEVDAVESYVARAVPVLDQIKLKSGAYPAKLPTGILGERPELLRDDGDYSATRSTFRFEYIDEPAEWAGGNGPLEFDSTNRVWKYEDDGN